MDSSVSSTDVFLLKICIHSLVFFSTLFSVWHPTKLLVAIGVILISFCVISYRTKVYRFIDAQSVLPSTIVLFIVADDAVANKFDPHIAGITCYARRHSYSLTVVHPKQYPACTINSISIYFQKHCLILMYLIDNPQIQWLVALDIDVLVLNMFKKIESYLPDPRTEPAMHLILHEKFNGEITAGNYIIRNHPWSHRFLSHWLQFERKTSLLKFHNHDNGPLYLHLLGEMVGNVSQSAYDRCFRVYQNTTEHSMYHTYVGCSKCALGGRWEFEHVRILRRGQAFIRDNLAHNTNQRIWGSVDFFVHAHQVPFDVYYSQQINIAECDDPMWNLPLRTEFIVSDYNQIKEIIRKFDREAAQAYPQSVGLPDISDCWPHCLDTDARRQAFIEKVCNRNATWISF